jgi:hypothetical protein
MGRTLLMAWGLLGFGSSAFAQSAAPPQTVEGFQLFPRYDFHLNAEHLSHDDPRYVWDMNYGGELDLFAYRSTRMTFVANYQAMLGEQMWEFDPNQGNYVLGGSLMTVINGVEVGPVFYHQSRHLSDRAKDFPVDWNMLGGRVAKHIEEGGTTLDLRLDLRRTIQRTYVDYQWELDAGGIAQFRLHPHLALVGRGFLRRLTVDGSRNRGTQTGGRVDGGIRIDGAKGAVEFFLAVERRIDPYQLEFGTERWTSVGMRLLSR